MTNSKIIHFLKVRDNFVAQWGALGSAWGINKTMAQIHALLMISSTPLDTDEIMQQLKSSRGNTNTNLRELIGWGLISKVTYPGDRKEYFKAEKDVWKIFCTVARERQRREIEPALKLLRESISELGKCGSDEEQIFVKQMKELEDFVATASSVLEKTARSEKNKIIPKILKLFR